MTNRRMQGLLEWLDGERLVASGHRAATIENHLKNALEVDKILNERPPSGEMVMVLKSFAENRCYACGWPLAGSATNGCTPFNCSYRPSEQSAGHSYWLKKAHEMERVRAMLSAAEAEGGKG